MDGAEDRWGRVGTAGALAGTVVARLKLTRPSYRPHEKINPISRTWHPIIGGQVCGREGGGGWEEGGREGRLIRFRRGGKREGARKEGRRVW